jgi:hypothetical protein
MKDLKGKFVSFKYRERKDIISGFLIDFNDNWTLIKWNPVDYVIDGYRILKTNKILKYKREDFEEFREKVLITKGLKPTVNERFPLTDINETLQLISDKFGAFQIEEKDETACYIGKLIKANKKEIVIQEIDPKANWVESEKYRLDSIRIIEFDTDYINSLILYNKHIEK